MSKSISNLNLSALKGLTATVQTDNKVKAFPSQSALIPCNRLRVDADGFKVGESASLSLRLYGSKADGFNLEFGVAKSFDKAAGYKGYMVPTMQSKGIVALSDSLLTADRPDKAKVIKALLSVGKESEFTLWSESSALYNGRFETMQTIPESERESVTPIETSALRIAHCGDNTVVYFLYSVYNADRTEVNPQVMAFVMTTGDFRKGIDSLKSYDSADDFLAYAMTVQAEHKIVSRVNRRTRNKANVTLG